MEFQNNFAWGVASSSYQVEGATYADGKGLHIWDVFAREDGRIYENHNGETACEFYTRYKEDIHLMKELGVKAYRFSINWTRILPDGIGKINEAGIDFYNRVIDELLANGIEPYITLFHWEYPYELYKKGGWMNRESADWFAEYAAVVADHYSDRVQKYFTINEPQCFIGLGYLTGAHAPGLNSPNTDVFQMAQNVLRAHAKAVQALRAHAKQPILVGFAPTGQISYPQTTSTEDIEAARKHLFACPTDMKNWTWNLAWWMDPVLLGHYPEEGLRQYERFLPKITAEDMKLIHEPIDFLGQNIYNGHMVAAPTENSSEEAKRRGYDVLERHVGFSRTASDWPVTPDCLYWGPRFLSERYHQIPIYITENGVSCTDVVSLDGKVHDPNRIDFLARYIGRLRDAVNDGIDVRGYFHWAFTDNFEWSQGYKERFGLVYMDYQSQKRIPKDSAYWYKKVIESNGACL